MSLAWDLAQGAIRRNAIIIFILQEGECTRFNSRQSVQEIKHFLLIQINRKTKRRQLFEFPL